MRDYYAILQVRPEADAEVIAAAYRSLARKYHPDHSPVDDAESRMRELNEAYEVLSDPERRRAYDAARTRHAAPLRPTARPARETDDIRRPVVQPVTPAAAVARRSRGARPVVLSVMWFACFVGAITAAWMVWRAEFTAPPPLPLPRATVPADDAVTPLSLPYRPGSPVAGVPTPTPSRD